MWGVFEEGGGGGEEENESGGRAAVGKLGDEVESPKVLLYVRGLKA